MGEGIGIERILQVKIPVSDLRRSVEWYSRTFDLRLGWEFVEDGVVRGAVLTDPSTGLLLGLRHREVVPGRPAFPGFDLLSFGVASPDALTALVERFDALGVEHSPLFDRGPGGGVQLDVPDPDGTVIRFLSPFGDHPPFLGLEFHRDGRPRPTTVLVCWPLRVAGSSSQALGGCMTSIEEIFRLVGHHAARS